MECVSERVVSPYFWPLVKLQVLSDDDKRSRYDRFGEAGLKGAGAGGPSVRLASNV